MKILITGAFGNLGLMCIEQALALNYDVVAFDLKTLKNEKTAEKFPTITPVFGDICDAELLSVLLDGVDAIIHNASVLPPLTENNPALAEKINIDACKTLIQYAEKSACPPVFIFPSSVTVFGLPESPYALKNADDNIIATDNYTRHKITIEKYLQQCSLPWVILRIGVSVDARTLKTDRATFKSLLQIRADNPLEYIHPKDVALAMCQAAVKTQARGKILLLGGGPSCQITQRAFISTAFSALGLHLPESIHGQNSFYTHHMNTVQSQQILQFQQHTFADYIIDMQKTLNPLKNLLWPLRWIINPLLGPLLRRL